MDKFPEDFRCPSRLDTVREKIYEKFQKAKSSNHSEIKFSLKDLDLKDRIKILQEILDRFDKVFLLIPNNEYIRVSGASDASYTEFKVWLN